MDQNPVFESFIGKLINEKKYKNYLKKGIEQYDILKYKISHISVFDVKKMYYKIAAKYSQLSNAPQTQNPTQQNGWLINQLKIFVWVAVCYAFQEDQHLASLNVQGWNFLVSVFYFKPLEILQYQLLSLMKGDSSSQDRKWSQPQNQVLKEVLTDPQLQNKWNQISKLFFLQSSKKYFRKPQKCRQHWNNHLNPSISHDPWTQAEDHEMIEHVNKIGKRWSQVSMLMGGHRTEHMVKNRYKSLQKKFQCEIMQSEKKHLEVSMLIKKLNEKSQRTHRPFLIKIDSTQTLIDSKTQQLFPSPQPRNIEQIVVQAEFQKCEFIDFMNFNIDQTEEKLVEVPYENFFANQKKSLGLMSEIDDEIQKYVESFLF